MSWEVSAEVEEQLFEYEDDYFTVKQVRVNIFGQEFYLDPDQANDLKVDIANALEEIGE